MNESSRVSNPDLVLSAPLKWEIDPEDVLWLRAVYEGEYVYLRMNRFPEENMYSFWIGDGRYIELEELPESWSDPKGGYKWPPSARPRRWED